MSGLRCAKRNTPRWTENVSAIQIKLSEMMKQPFNEFEQLETTISNKFVYTCALGTLGMID